MTYDAGILIGFIALDRLYTSDHEWSKCRPITRDDGRLPLCYLSAECISKVLDLNLYESLFQEHC